MNLESEARAGAFAETGGPGSEPNGRARLGGAWSTWSVDELLGLAAPLFAPSVVALGTFDGVHLGHRRILEEACRLARSLGAVPVALTFDRHPQQTLAPEKAPKLLSEFHRRLRLIREAGAEHSVVVRFDARFASLEAEAFVRRILKGALGSAGVVVGFNFRFGKGAKGDAAFLARAAEEGGFAVSVVPPVLYEGEPVSSTRIRAALEAGDVEKAHALLGRAFVLPGTVVRGDQRGRTLGFPTANLAHSGAIATPGDGVYATRVNVAGPKAGAYGALTVIGNRPSFGRLERTIESYLLDFEGDLYGAAIEIAFLRRLRGVVRFESVEALKEQIHRDVAQAKAFFADRSDAPRR